MKFKEIIKKNVVQTFALLHCSVLNHLYYAAIFLEQIDATSMMYLDKQLR